MAYLPMGEGLATVLDKIGEAHAVVIGASNGLSISEGINIFAEDEAFLRHFGDFRRQHGFRSIIHGCFHPFHSAAQYWAFHSRMYKYFLGEARPSQVMQDLYALVQDKRHFVVTSNIDAHFHLAGFAPERLFEIEGNCRNLQCAGACHDRLYPGDELLAEMTRTQQDGKVPEHLIPACPACGGAMRVHIDIDPRFLKGVQWQASYQAFADFMLEARGEQTVFLEFGVGSRNRLIKAPFVRIVRQEPQATYVCFNRGAELAIPAEIVAKSIGIDGDIAGALSQLVAHKAHETQEVARES